MNESQVANPAREWAMFASEKTAFARAANLALGCGSWMRGYFVVNLIPSLLSPPECFTSNEVQGTINVKEEGRCHTVE